VALGWSPALLGPLWGALGGGGLALYALLAFAEALRMARSAPKEKRTPALLWYTASGIAVTHLSYGWNFLRGLLSPRLHEEKTPAAA